MELKAVARTLVEHEVQLVNYLTATDAASGLLLNFGGKSVEVKRRFKRTTNRHDEHGEDKEDLGE